MKDKFEVMLKIRGTLYAYGQQSAEGYMHCGLAELLKYTGIFCEKIEIQVKQK